MIEYKLENEITKCETNIGLILTSMTTYGAEATFFLQGYIKVTQIFLTTLLGPNLSLYMKQRVTTKRQHWTPNSINNVQARPT